MRAVLVGVFVGLLLAYGITLYFLAKGLTHRGW